MDVSAGDVSVTADCAKANKVAFDVSVNAADSDAVGDISDAVDGLDDDSDFSDALSTSFGADVGVAVSSVETEGAAASASMFVALGVAVFATLF